MPTTLEIILPPIIFICFVFLIIMLIRFVIIPANSDNNADAKAEAEAKAKAEAEAKAKAEAEAYAPYKTDIILSEVVLRNYNDITNPRSSCFTNQLSTGGDCTWTDWQLWNVLPRKNNKIAFQNKNTGKCIKSNGKGNKVSLVDCTDPTLSTDWDINNGGSFVRYTQDGNCLTSNGNLEDCNGNNSQRWLVSFHRAFGALSNATYNFFYPNPVVSPYGPGVGATLSF